MYVRDACYKTYCLILNLLVLLVCYECYDTDYLITRKLNIACKIWHAVPARVHPKCARNHGGP